MPDLFREGVLLPRQNLAKRFRRGDACAAIRIFCLECHAGDPVAVRRCDQTGCALWRHRLDGTDREGSRKG